jgi:hypothetical protein
MRATEITLAELVEKNSNKGIYRQQILEKIKNESLIVATNRRVTELQIDHNSKNIQCLTSTSPETTGTVLIAFVNESTMHNRNSNSFPFIIDLKGIKILIKDLDLSGLIVISASGWVFFRKEDLDI